MARVAWILWSRSPPCLHGPSNLESVPLRGDVQVDWRRFRMPMSSEKVDGAANDASLKIEVVSKGEFVAVDALLGSTSWNVGCKVGLRSTRAEVSSLLPLCDRTGLQGRKIIDF